MNNINALHARNNRVKTEIRKIAKEASTKIVAEMLESTKDKFDDILGIDRFINPYVDFSIINEAMGDSFEIEVRHNNEVIVHESFPRFTDPKLISGVYLDSVIDANDFKKSIEVSFDNLRNAHSTALSKVHEKIRAKYEEYGIK